MARFPGAVWRPIEARFLPQRRMTAYNRVNLHTAVSNSSSLHSFFNAPGRASSHFYVRDDGTVEQYVDTAWQAEADRDGNDATISIETWDGFGRLWSSGHPPRWTPAQMQSLVRLIVWCHRTHGIPLRLATSSKIGPESRGISWHRLGVDGNFPALPDIRAGRKQRGGGMLYSKDVGKVCPGDNRIRQIPELLRLAIAQTAPAQTTNNKPTPPAPEADVPLNADDLSKIRTIVRDEVLRSMLGYRNRELGHNIDIHQRILDLWQVATGKKPEAAIHPRDRKPGEF